MKQLLRLVLLTASVCGLAACHPPTDSSPTLTMADSDEVEPSLIKSDGSMLIQLTSNGRNNYLPAWSPDGRSLSFISQKGKDTTTAEIYAIHVDGNDEQRLTHNTVWEYGMGWSADGSQIFFGSRRDNQWQLYLMGADGSNQRPFPTPAYGNAPVWSPDGTHIAFTSDQDGDDEIWVMNFDGSEAVNLTQDFAFDAGVPDCRPMAEN